MPHCSEPSNRYSEAERRLLYVGSDLGLLKSLRTTFGEPKYHIVSCPDRLSAEMFIRSQIQYQLFIFDHEMRDRAAFDLAGLLRSLDHRQNLPAIVVGAEVESALREFTRASGGNDYVGKADHFLAVLRLVKPLLKDSRSHAATREAGTA